MSLVMAFSGKKRAIMAGDRRSIIFFQRAEALEEELYSGRINTDVELLNRSQELGLQIRISDARDKVWRRGPVLVGEVAETTLNSDKRRRVYAVPGGYLLAEIKNSKAVVRQQGNSSLIILGNEITKKLAYERLAKIKSFDESIFISAFNEIRKNTASVSSDFTVISTDKVHKEPRLLLFQALREDCEEKGWQISDLQ